MTLEEIWRRKSDEEQWSAYSFIVNRLPSGPQRLLRSPGVPSGLELLQGGLHPMRER